MINELIKLILATFTSNDLKKNPALAGFFYDIVCIK